MKYNHYLLKATDFMFVNLSLFYVNFCKKERGLLLLKWRKKFVIVHFSKPGPLLCHYDYCQCATVSLCKERINKVFTFVNLSLSTFWYHTWFYINSLVDTDMVWVFFTRFSVPHNLLHDSCQFPLLFSTCHWFFLFLWLFRHWATREWVPST